MSKIKESGDKYVYRICSFLISSADGLPQEPEIYGSIRLLQTFSMVARLSNYLDELKRDDFLLEISDEIDEEIISISTSKTKVERLELMKKYTQKLSIKLAKELKRRKLEKS